MKDFATNNNKYFINKTTAEEERREEEFNLMKNDCLKHGDINSVYDA